MRNIVILGSTGSIGTQALAVVREYNALPQAKQEPMRVSGIAAYRNVELIEKQVREFRPACAVLYEEEAARELRTRLKDLPVRVSAGMEGLCELAACDEADIVLTSIVGMIGIKPTIAAIRAGKDIALANKETLVAAGEIIMPLVKRHGVRMLPVDSEHSAIFQCLNGEAPQSIEEILLTASGGPFRGMNAEQLRTVKKEDALRHPNWAMGAKITVDSATMVNKGLEVIEAMHLFSVSLRQIRVLVQPKSIVHSMVQFRDGSVMAQMGAPDMKLPIAYALTLPARSPMQTKRLDFAALQQITFEEPDTKTFRGLPLAYEAAKTGGTMPAVFNAANEEAVARFLRDEIRLPDLYDMIADACAAHTPKSNPALEDIFDAEQEARAFVRARGNTI